MKQLEKQYERLENGWSRASKGRKTLIYIGVYTAVFLMAFFLAYSPYLRAGKSFVWMADGRNQHFPFLVYLGRSIRKVILNALHGNFSIPLFDLNIGLGNDIIGFLNPNWASDPLSLLSVFVPTHYTEALYGFLTIFRVYLAGLSFSFLCRYFNKRGSYALIGSVIYCFSGYAIFCSMRHPGFIDPMYTLPLLIVGTDKLLKHEKPYIFIFAVFYAVLCGYYHLYMMTVMIGVYALVRTFDLFKAKWLRESILAAGRCMGCYLLGIGLGALVFFPSVAEFLNAGRSGFSNYTPRTYTWKYFGRYLLRLIAPSSGTSWDYLALAAIVLFAIALLFLSHGRWSVKLLTLSAFAIWLTGMGGLIMNGFQYSSNRWTFGLALILAFVVVEMLPELLELTGKQQGICLAVLCAYAAIVFFIVYFRTQGYALVGVCFLSLTLLVLVMPLGRQASSRRERLCAKNFRSIICVVLVVINVGINGIYFYGADQGNYIAEFAESGYETERLEGAIERDLGPYLSNEPEGRADGSSFSRSSNMVWRIPGMLGFNSTMNQNVIHFWTAMENFGNYMLFEIISTDQRTMVNTLLSEKYHIETEKRTSYVPFGYTQIKKTKNGNLIYENNYALPWGYTYDAVISYETLEAMNGVEKQQAMLQAIALDGEMGNEVTENIIFSEKRLPYTVEYQNCSWEDGVLKVTKANATITLNFAMPADVEGYVRLKNFDINGSGLDRFTQFRVTCGEVTKTTQVTSNRYNWYYGRENYLANLGYSSEERNSLTLTFPAKGTFKLEDIDLYALPMDNYPQQVEALRAEPLENIEMTKNHILGTVDLSKDKVLCMSIPHSKGWSATVDGEKVEILRGNYMFMAIPLSAGHHDIEFSYCSPGLKLGAGVSVISLGIVIGMLVIDRKKRKTSDIPKEA